MSGNHTIVCQPQNVGWLEEKMTGEVMSYLWKLVDNKKGVYSQNLAGVIHESFELNDENNWFFDNVLIRLCDTYNLNFGRLYQRYQHDVKSENLCLENIWVNYQKQTDFNPPHTHNGIFSFVIWMKIPTNHIDQNKNNKSNSKVVSSFEFLYHDLLGSMHPAIYEMNPEVEGTLLFFPSNLHHCVYPFFNCDEDRISISGNINAKKYK
jgi:hypothetical protein